MGGIVDLQLFSDRLLQRLVVGDLQHDCCHLLSELFFQFRRCRFGVFDCVVQQGGAEYNRIRNPSFVCQDVSNRDWMVDGAAVTSFRRWSRCLAAAKTNTLMKSFMIIAWLWHPASSRPALKKKSLCFRVGAYRKMGVSSRAYRSRPRIADRDELLLVRLLID
jgi:hypothetical protein